MGGVKEELGHSIGVPSRGVSNWIRTVMPGSAQGPAGLQKAGFVRPKASGGAMVVKEVGEVRGAR